MPETTAPQKKPVYTDQAVIQAIKTLYPAFLKRDAQDAEGLFTLEEVKNAWKYAFAKTNQTKIPVHTLVVYMVQKKLTDLIYSSNADWVPEYERKIKNYLAALETKDSQTALNVPLFMDLNLLLLAHFQEEASGALHYFTADIGNLRGLNEALTLASERGESQDRALVSNEAKRYADKILRVIAGIVQSELEVALKPRAGEPKGDFRLYREGGDEFSAVIFGASEEAIKDAVKRIGAAVGKLAETLHPLSHIPHPKYPDNISRKGVTISCASRPYTMEENTALSPIESLITFRRELDNAVNEEKKKPPRADRMLMNGNPAAKKVSAVKTRKQYDNATMLPDNEIMGIRHIIDQIVEGKLGIDGQDYRTHEQDRRAHEKDPEHWYQGVYAPPHLQSGPSAKTEDFSCWPPEDCEPVPASVPPEAQALLKGLQALVMSLDPYTKARMGSYNDALNHAVRHVNATGTPLVALAFEMQNFVGLNEGFGHKGCDWILGKITHEIGEAAKVQGMSENMRIYRPEGRGDRIYMLLPETDWEAIYYLAGKVTDKARVVIHQEKTPDLGVHISKLANPRHPGHPGVRVVIAAQTINQGAFTDAAGVFQRLNGQLRENKTHSPPLLFDAQFIGGEKTIPFVPSQVEALCARTDAQSSKTP